MKKSITVLALALALTGTLAACSTEKAPNTNNAGSAGSQSGTTSGSTGTAGSGSSGSAGQVSRRYSTPSNSGHDFFDDGHYAAGANGQVYGGSNSTLGQDLTRGARDIVRGTEDVMDDIGNGIGNAARDITGTGAGTGTGTPSWEPDSSAVRY